MNMGRDKWSANYLRICKVLIYEPKLLQFLLYFAVGLQLQIMTITTDQWLPTETGLLFESCIFFPFKVSPYTISDTTKKPEWDPKLKK